MKSILYVFLGVILGIGLMFLYPHLGSSSAGHGSSAHASPTHAESSVVSNVTRTQISRIGTVATKYPPELAIQLFTAEGEIYWLGDAGWNPAFLRGDGFNPNDVFTLENTTFITMDYDIERGFVRYSRVWAGMSAGTIEINIKPKGNGSVTEVSYVMTGLSDAGDSELDKVTTEAFAKQMDDWETAIKNNTKKIDDWLAKRN